MTLQSDAGLRRVKKISKGGCGGGDCFDDHLGGVGDDEDDVGVVVVVILMILAVVL